MIGPNSISPPVAEVLSSSVTLGIGAFVGSTASSLKWNLPVISGALVTPSSTSRTLDTLIVADTSRYVLVNVRGSCGVEAGVATSFPSAPRTTVTVVFNSVLPLITSATSPSSFTR